VPGAVLITPAMAGQIVNPESQPPADLAVAYNFERFDGFDAPTDHAPGQRLVLGTDNPRPGQQPTPRAQQTYTPSTLSGTVSTLGGQPLPVADAIHRPPGGYTPAKSPTIQWRLGVGQAGPSALGAAQTVQLGEITSNPPQPGDLASIIAGQS
jgi:hypothetical protein